MSRLRQILEFIEAAPDDPFLHFALAKEYSKEGRVEDAVSTYSLLTEKYPQYVATYYHYGLLLKNLHRIPDALVVLEQGISVAQDVKDLHALSELRQLKMNIELEQ